MKVFENVYEEIIIIKKKPYTNFKSFSTFLVNLKYVCRIKRNSQQQFIFNQQTIFFFWMLFKEWTIYYLHNLGIMLLLLYSSYVRYIFGLCTSWNIIQVMFRIIKWCKFFYQTSQLNKTNIITICDILLWICDFHFNICFYLHHINNNNNRSIFIWPSYKYV